MDKAPYLTTIQTWRKEYENRLASPDGWLSITGLFWLKEGENRIGSDPNNEVALPEGTAANVAGVFTLKGNQISLEASDDNQFVIEEKSSQKLKIKLNEYGSSEWILHNDLKISVIQRGIRYGVRVYDANHPARKQFVNLRWYPVDQSFRVTGRFYPFETPKKLDMINVLGDRLELPSPGFVEFELSKQKCRLQPVSEGPEDGLWFMFRDSTNGNQTYPGGRFLDADWPDEAFQVTIDFNKAHNPPCAYTDFATCPLPPEENRMELPVTSGELKFH